MVKNLEVGKCLRVCFSGDGQGEVAAAIRTRLVALGKGFVKFTEDLTDKGWQRDVADVAICTTGRMLIREPAALTEQDLDGLCFGNYLYPRRFTETHILAMKAENVRGLIIHLGSNAAWYGNVGAEDYAAFKSALRKYLGFGGIDTAFWKKATAGADPELCKTIVPGARKPLTADEAAAVVVATILLPENVVIRDALVVSTEYQ